MILISSILNSGPPPAEVLVNLNCVMVLGTFIDKVLEYQVLSVPVPVGRLVTLTLYQVPTLKYSIVNSEPVEVVEAPLYINSCNVNGPV